VTRRAMIVLRYIKDRCGKKITAWPKVATIAEGVGYSVRSVRYALRELEQLGELSTICRYRTDGGQSSNLYVLQGGSAKSADRSSQLNCSVNINKNICSQAEIKSLIHNATGATIDNSFAATIHKEYTLTQLVRCLQVLNSQKGYVRNIGGWLRVALREGYELVEAV
jgi:GntR family transcriptional regulator